MNSNKLNLCLLISFVAIFSICNSVLSEEKPLDTIGEPQLQKVKTDTTKQTPATTTTNLNNQNKTTTGTSSPFYINMSPDNKPAAAKAQPTTAKTQPAQTQPTQNIPKLAIPAFTQNQPSSTIKVEKQAPVIEEIKPAAGSPQEQQSLIFDPNNKFGLIKYYNELDKSVSFLKKKDIASAKAIVAPIAEWLTTLTEYHIQLFKKLNTIDTGKNQAQVEKKLALDFAMLRDKAYYQLGLIYLGENNDKDATKYLIEVVKSQPQTELGMKAYEILQQIGFTEKIRLIP